MLSARPPAAERGSLATRAASYAGVTMVALCALQLLVLRPAGALGVAVVVLPFFVCTAMTYVITRAIVHRRARALTEAYLRFAIGDLGDDIPFPPDPEFHDTHELFMRLARELHRATRELERRDAERRRLFSDVVHELGTPVSSLLGLAEAFERPQLVATAEQRGMLARAMLHAHVRRYLLAQGGGGVHARVVVRGGDPSRQNLSDYSPAAPGTPSYGPPAGAA